jgi:ankyrin repeat protein
MWAVACRQSDTARRVFESCKGIVLPPTRLRTALFLATQNWSRVIVKLLIDHGADVNARIGWSGHVLQAASLRGDTALVQSLLNAGADVNAQGGHYGNALRAASWAGHEDIVDLLVRAGAVISREGDTYVW